MKNNEKEIREILNKYIESSEYKFNPDTTAVDRVIKGMVKRKEKFGEYYCPCRIISGNKEEDKDKICPCIWHKEEIEKDGMCHCHLFVKKA